mgnify:CR=1 FL=1
MNAQLKKGALEVCVLSQLAKGDKYGYELTEVISQEMTIAVGTLYPILKRLKDDLYVDTYLVESDGGTARKYYHLTEKGQIYQQKLKQEWEDFVLAMKKLLD